MTGIDDPGATDDALTEAERLDILHEVFDQADGTASEVHHTHHPDDEDAVGPLFQDTSEEE